MTLCPCFIPFLHFFLPPPMGLSLPCDLDLLHTTVHVLLALILASSLGRVWSASAQLSLISFCDSFIPFRFCFFTCTLFQHLEIEKYMSPTIVDNCTLPISTNQLKINCGKLKNEPLQLHQCNTNTNCNTNNNNNNDNNNNNNGNNTKLHCT